MPDDASGDPCRNCQQLPSRDLPSYRWGDDGELMSATKVSNHPNKPLKYTLAEH